VVLWLLNSGVEGTFPEECWTLRRGQLFGAPRRIPSLEAGKHGGMRGGYAKLVRMRQLLFLPINSRPPQLFSLLQHDFGARNY
jgi:hypothetical protein